MRWSHNLHCHRLVLRALPDGAGSALDVGCGDGLPVRELAARVPVVVEIDVHPASVERGRREAVGPGVELVGDVRPMV